MNSVFHFEVKGFDTPPLITQASSTNVGDNINGSSVIRAPEWLPNASGGYLMYFAHHGGSLFRTAFADRTEGSWTVHDGKCLCLEQVFPLGFVDPIASPDVHVDHQNRPEPLASWRHWAVWPRGDALLVFFSRRNGDSPERILYSRLDMRADWNSWEFSTPFDALRPEGRAEGADLPVFPSREGAAHGRLHERRDPCVFEDNGRLILFLFHRRRVRHLRRSAALRYNC